MRDKQNMVVAIAGLFLCISTAQALNENQPHIGYVYPAGGQQGTKVRITIGGQFLRGANSVYVSGKGVRARVLQYCRPFNNINRDQRNDLEHRMKAVRDARLAELNGKPALDSKKSKADSKKEEKKPPQQKMPDHPLIYDLENKSLRELGHITNMFFKFRRKRQPNRQIAETVVLEVTLSQTAPVGNRELRLITNQGLTNPVVFQVGNMTEVQELEPNNQAPAPPLPAAPKLALPKPHELPVTLNGQIMPGDTDRFSFRAKAGQELVIKTEARSLIPYLADAVPGWFQATVTLYDAKGNEAAFVDDYRFNPDPVLFYHVPEDGVYELAINDSIYRGREDFVYRISIGQRPFITQIFPLGGKIGQKTTAKVDGRHLSNKQVSLDTSRGTKTLRRLAMDQEKGLSNEILYAVDTLPECLEADDNNTIASAQKIELPMIVNGRIEKAGDTDVFRFQGKAKDQITAEVFARRLNSPLDSLVRLTDQQGKTVAWNDDYVLQDKFLHKDITGLVTHHADSYMTAELPKDGVYYVHLSDSQHHGGSAFGYRLRVSAPQPDFALRVTPSNVTISPGGIAPICVHVLRKDGFKGDIEVVLNNTSAGFQLHGGRIPRDKDRVYMTLTAPAKAPYRALPMQLMARGVDGDRSLLRSVVPSDDTMQAFLYRHLVPCKEFLVLVKKQKWSLPPVRVADGNPVRIYAGKSIPVRVKTRKRPILEQLRLELYEPPEGVSLSGVKVVEEGLEFQLKAETDIAKAGLKDNLIVEMIREQKTPPKDGKGAAKVRRYSMGVLPAIPIEIVSR